jgi:predicted  nucleic acid-binding Zn-ribbon protein
MVETFGWGVLTLSLTGLFVSSCTVAFIAGFKRGIGQFRLSNPFGERPLAPRVDQQYIVDYEMMKGANSNLNREIVNLTTQNRDLEKEIKILEGKIRAGDRRRAKRDETLVSLYTASTPEDYIVKYEQGKAQETKEEMVETVKKYARRKAAASDAK